MISTRWRSQQGGVPPLGRAETGREPGVRRQLLADSEPTLDQKIELLSQPSVYAHPVTEVVRRETHMSWVFLAGDQAYKLKKPCASRISTSPPWRGARPPAGQSFASTAGSRPRSISTWYR